MQRAQMGSVRAAGDDAGGLRSGAILVEWACDPASGPGERQQSRAVRGSNAGMRA